MRGNVMSKWDMWLRPWISEPRTHSLASLLILAVLTLVFPPAAGINSFVFAGPALILGYIFTRGLFAGPSVSGGEAARIGSESCHGAVLRAGRTVLKGACVAVVWLATVLPYPIHAAVELFDEAPQITHRVQAHPDDHNCRVSADQLPDLIPSYFARGPSASSYVLSRTREPSQLESCTYMAIAPEDRSSRDRFRLSVLQFKEDGRLVGGGCVNAALAQCPDPQMRALLAGLHQTDGNLVVVYVHGWRHDSRDRDSDLGRLATLAAYSSSFVDQRSSPERPGSPLTVTAVFVGWRGSLLKNDDGGFWSTLMAALTFPSRKNASDRASSGVVEALDTIEAALKRSDQNFSRSGVTRSRMLVVGHSAGGNLLMEGLRRRMSAMLREQISRSSVLERAPIMPSPVGDLVVLLNPAAEARKWVEIQRTFFDTVEEQRGAAPPLPSRIPGRKLVHAVFPNSQPPSVIAITAGSFRLEAAEIAERLADAPDLRGRQAEDSVTATVFKLSQMIFFGEWLSEEGRTAIGHYLAGEVFDANGRRTPPYPGMPPGSRLGVTHSVEANGSAGVATHFMRARTSSRCEWMDENWLWYMRRVEAGISPGRFKNRRDLLRQSPDAPALSGWDGNSLAANVRSFGRIRTQKTGDDLGSNYINMQFRHRPDRDGPPSAVPPTFPFWNVKAIDTTIAGHGDFVSYPLWCSLHQLVLDDPAQAPAIGPAAPLTPPSPFP